MVDGEEFVINGAKRWIGNGTIADVIVLWARGEDGEVGGYLIEKDTPGYEATVITGRVRFARSGRRTSSFMTYACR